MREVSWPRVRALVAAVLLITGVLRYLHASIGSTADATWITLLDQLGPLIGKTWHGSPLETTISPFSLGLRYGPVFYLIAGPIVAATRSLTTLHTLLALFAHLCFWLTLFLLDRRLFRLEHWSIRAIFVGVALNFTPALEALRCACLDTWEMLSIAASFFIFTSTLRWRREIAAAPVTAGVLTKLMPALALLFVIVRRWTAIFVAAAVTLLILTLGQIFFGSTMGFGFPERALRVMLLFGARRIPLWWENDSPRGLIFKALSGFHLKPGTLYVEVSPSARLIVDVTMTAAALAMLAWVIVRLWHWSASEEGEDLLVVGGFASAVLVHHLISPYSTHQYLPSTLVAYAFVLCCLLRRFVSRGEVVLAAISLVLIGNIPAKSILVTILGLAKINALLHSAPSLDAGQMCTFYGLPGVGVILLAIVVLRLQRRLVSGEGAAHR